MRWAVLFVLCAFALSSASARKRPTSKHSPKAANPCANYPIDVHEVWVVTETETDFYAPGSPLRGPDVPLARRRYSILINNTFPGPTLKLKIGDWVRIDVFNNMLSTPISIHWHGIDQKGTPWADGTGMVTSCPIESSSSGGANSFSYIWQATGAGTYWYHGHAALEHEYGVLGAIVIEDPHDPFRSLYDAELPDPIIVTDWWRDPNAQFALMPAYGFYGTLDGANINGYFGNGTAKFPNTVLITMEQNMCYRIRFVCANGEWEGWEGTIVGQKGNTTVVLPMTIIAVDSTNIKPVTVDQFAFYAAERVDAVVCTDIPGGRYMLLFQTVQNVGTCSYPDCQIAVEAWVNITKTEPAVLTTKVKRAKFDTFPNYTSLDILKDGQLIVPYKATPPPPRADTTWTFRMGFSNSAAFLWTEGWEPTILPSAPYLFTKGSCGTIPETHVKHVTQLGTVADIIVNNLGPVLHVFHLHGHDFWVLGSGFYVDAGSPASNADSTNQTFCSGHWEASDPSNPASAPPGAWGCPYNQKTDHKDLNMKDPWITDSVPVGALGWVYLRVKFDNPGVWYAHCHLNNHMMQGMGFLVNVAPSKQPPIPAWVNTRCGGTCAPAAAQECGPFTPPANVKQPMCIPDCEIKSFTGYCTGKTPAVYEPSGMGGWMEPMGGMVMG